MKPDDRDEFLQGWQQPDLLLQHLSSAASYGASDLAVFWSRLGALTVGALAVLGGCAWLFQVVLGGAGALRWTILIPLLLALTFVVLTFFKLLRCATPLHQSEPHQLQRLRAAWEESRRRFKSEKPQADDVALHHYTDRIERTLILANWTDVAEDFAKQNKDRLSNAKVATRHLSWSVVLLGTSVVVWATLLPLQPRSDRPNLEVQAGPTMPDDGNQTPVVHPPTEVTERNDPPAPPPVHPPTEVTEKGNTAGQSSGDQ